MSADPNSVTVSGHSAGCFMADEMMMVHSESIKGAGLFQCWPYGVLSRPDLVNENSSAELQAEVSIGQIAEAEAAGKIDPTSNLANNSVYIFTGGEDDITPAPMQEAMNTVYEHYGVTNLHHVVDPNVDHWFESEVMLPGLKQMFVDLGYANDTNDFNELAADTSNGIWSDFDQTEFVVNQDFSRYGWDTTGKVFIPNQCNTKTCKLHISFHSCGSDAATMAERSSYALLGSTNDIIMVFPESYCWGIDDDNATSSLYGTYESEYVQSINNMICRLTSSEANNNCETVDRDEEEND